MCLDERSAAFVALGLARARRRPAAVVTTSGTAVVNLHPAVVEAAYADVPLLVLTADRPPELRGTAANQTIDQIKAFGDHVRWFVEVGAAADVPGANAYWRSLACQAWARAEGLAAPPGPVHLNLAFREPTIAASDDGRTSAEPFTGPLDGRRDGRPWTIVRRAPRRDDTGTREAARRLREADRAVLVVGTNDLVPAPVTQLARAAGIPIVAEPLSNARRGGSGIAHAELLVAGGLAPRPDLAIRIGRTGLSRAVEGWLGPEVPQLLVDQHGQFLDPGRSIGEVVVADPEPWCAAVAADLRTDPPPARDWLAAWRDADERVAEVVDRHLDAAPLCGPSVARALVGALPHDAALVIASSAPIRDVNAYAPLREDLWMVGNRGASGIDGFVSTSLGVALARPGSATVALAGDLSFLHDQGGWLLSPEGVDADLVMVVVDNDGGGLFHHLPVADAEGFERLFATPHGRDLGAIAAAHGLEVHRPRDREDLASGVLDAVQGGGRHLVHVRSDREAEADLRRSIAREVAGLSGIEV